MGRYNTNAPEILGVEDRYDQRLAFGLSSQDVMLLQRLRPGAGSLAKVHAFLDNVRGPAPGYALELVSGDPIVPTTEEHKFPGTDILTTGWKDTGAGTTNLWEWVNEEWNFATYIRNSSAIAPSRKALFRGGATALAGKRVQLLIVGVTLRWNVNLYASIDVRGVLRLGGVDYFGFDQRLFGDKPWRWIKPIYGVGVWRLNPVTDKPWTQAEINNIITAAGTDAFGIEIRNPIGIDANGNRLTSIPTESVHVTSVVAGLITADENRLWSFYSSAKPRDGWDAYTAPNATLLDNTHYWLVAYPLVGSPSNTVTLTTLGGPAPEAASAASAIGEHRESLAAFGTWGIPHTPGAPRDALGATRGTPGQMLAFLLETTRTVTDGATTNADKTVTSATAAFTSADLGCPISGTNIPAGSVIDTINSPTSVEISQNATATGAGITLTIGSILAESQAYCGFWPIGVHDGATANMGQKLTPGANKDYARLVLRSGWGGPNKPTQPLIVKVCTGIGGTGEIARFEITASAGDRAVRDRVVDTTAFSAVAGTPLFLLLESASSPSAPWLVERLDTCSDRRGPSTTAAQVEGASHGGRTDSFVANGAQDTRFDLAVALIAAPDPPANFVVTPVEAA